MISSVILRRLMSLMFLIGSIITMLKYVTVGSLKLPKVSVVSVFLFKIALKKISVHINFGVCKMH